MYRIVRLSKKWYAMPVRSVDADLTDINHFINSGEVVMLVQDIADAEHVTGIMGEKIEVIENE